MHLVVPAGPGELVLNYLYLPTFIGMNAPLMEKLEKELGPEIVGKELTEASMADMDKKIIRWICSQFPSLTGLDDYLDGIKFIQAQDSSVAHTAGPGTG